MAFQDNNRMAFYQRNQEMMEVSFSQDSNNFFDQFNFNQKAALSNSAPDVPEINNEYNAGLEPIVEGHEHAPQQHNGQSGTNVRKNYPKNNMTIKDLDQLCKNYMRGGCDFPSCKFYHPTPTELIVYSKTIQEAYIRKYGEIDICRDYLNNKCQRDSCKYKHPDEYWLDVYQRFNNGTDECGQAIKLAERLKQQINKPALKLTAAPLLPQSQGKK